ncbi:sensor histidine kinase [Alkalicoccus daliensis]|uniref:histidine kinase n=1 Tax=Alkalicoccus daliensis TaxID=745820 RepID=A0A1H0GES2_9BACI|nr:histidine kinase [Alkalicoccus daliensis]SDO05358.1 HAMP domain-containing protein [Alkalicoccus daliensis]
MALRNKFQTLVIFLVILPLLIVGWLTYDLGSSIYRDQINEHMQDTLNAIDLNIRTTMNEVDSFSDYVVTSGPVMNHLTVDTWANPQQEVQNENMISQLSFSSDLTYDFSLIPNTGEALYFIAPPEERFVQLEDSSLADAIIEKRGRTHWTGPSSEEMEEGFSPVFTVGRSVIHPQTLEQLGLFFLFVNPDLLQSADSLGANSETSWSILNENGETVYNTSPDLLGAEIDNSVLQQTEGTYTYEDQEFFYTSTETAQDWTLVSFINVQNMSTILVPARIFIAGIIASLLLLLFLFHKLFSQRLLQFIQRFNEGMTEAAEGNLQVKMEHYKEEEFQTLGTSFNYMVQELKTTIKQVEEEQQQKQRAEFKVLQHQINPHFLYNTLESVNALASLNKTEEVQHMVTNLGKLLRISLKGPYEISLAEEIKHVSSYLEIQRVRHSYTFDYEVQMEPELKTQHVLKLILQPIVENAIEHGMASTAFNVIKIQAFLSENSLALRVTDNGPGFPETVLKELNQRTQLTAFEGHGVLNVHDRIQLYYLKHSGLLICSEPGLTIVQLRIPLEEKEEENV